MGAIGKVGFKVIGMAIAIPSGILTRKALNKAWLSSRGHKPPGSKDSKSPEADWLEVVVWATVSAGVTAAVQSAATHGAAATYRALTGQHPPVKEKKKQKEKVPAKV
ncbi:MAG TPA: DUF4235 domain-containing protein [Mycobacteriales bacterium]|nr:DUF4235 domain-containing protein [Mycobacteriales bacterium]